MGMPPMASSCIAAVRADGKVARTRHPMPTRTLAAKRSCMPIKNAAVCVASPALIAGLSDHRVQLDQKKVAQYSRAQVCTTLLAPDPEDPTSTILELDELWSFVLKKAHDFWIWMALCRKSRQVVAYAVGDRSKRTCQRLWEAIPSAYRQGHCFTDFWAAYSAVIPEEQHTAVGKETGETAHVERWNNTLRQRLARFVRMTLSFSKSVIMHEACLLLFLHRYNRERAILLK
jgi:insertion element IS1 protein InsB